MIYQCQKCGLSKSDSAMGSVCLSANVIGTRHPYSQHLCRSLWRVGTTKQQATAQTILAATPPHPNRQHLCRSL